MASSVAGSMQLSGDLLLVNKNDCNTENKTYLPCYLAKRREESLICSEVMKIYNAISLGNSSFPPMLERVFIMANNLANQTCFTFFKKNKFLCV